MLAFVLILAIWLLVSLIIVFPLAEMMHVGSGTDADAEEPSKPMIDRVESFEGVERRETHSAAR
jgi:hypothetical protein